MDKNKATLDFIATYPGMATSPIFVNFINAKDNDIQFITTSNDKTLDRKFIDGSVMKQYTFSIMITKSITDLPTLRALEEGQTNENISDLADIQLFMDWVNEQGDNRNYPNFGSDCVIEEMRTTTENPDLEGLNTEVAPALALYSVEIRIDYIDYSKVVWS